MPKLVPKPGDAHVGARVRAQRLKLKISQIALGEKVGVSFQQVQKYENGTNRISMSRLVQIANVLGMHPTFFFVGLPNRSPTTDKAPSPKYIRDFVEAPEGLALIKAFMKLSPTLRRNIVTLVGNIAGKE